jgi:hypothetical protein
MLPAELYCRNLEGSIEPWRMEYMSPEEALRRLKNMTGEDFGSDVKRWREWFGKHPVRETKGQR